MITISHGDLLKADVEALVNTVNTKGVMGKGIALQFKRAYPAAFAEYEAACHRGEVRLGKMHVVDTGGLGGGTRWIINFPTKDHWRARSRLADIRSGLIDLVEVVKNLDIKSIAVPPLGCGHGGLSWRDVKPAIEEALADLPGVDVHLYPPEGAPAASEMVSRSAKPKMTIGRAALVWLMARYQRGLLDPIVSLLEVHKLMYFLQEAGQSLNLKYAKGTYGPYATNLRHVLNTLEGHWISGYGDGVDDPRKPIELKDDAVSTAETYLRDHPDLSQRIERVASLIDGFEDAYGLELLSSVHWVMCTSPEARDSADEAIKAVQAWNPRKAALLKPDHLRVAWQRLAEAKWNTEARSAIH